MSIKSLIINCVDAEYTQPYIANVFWKQNIAMVNNVTLIPYLKNGITYNIAYVKIEQWCDSELAYNFIQSLKNPLKETRIVHHEDNWWPCELNTHNNGDIHVGQYTVTFAASYFLRENPEEEATEATEATEAEDAVEDAEEAEAKDTKKHSGGWFSSQEYRNRMQQWLDLCEEYGLETENEWVEEYVDKWEQEWEKEEAEKEEEEEEELDKNVTIREKQNLIENYFVINV